MKKMIIAVTAAMLASPAFAADDMLGKASLQQVPQAKGVFSDNDPYIGDAVSARVTRKPGQTSFSVPLEIKMYYVRVQYMPVEQTYETVDCQEVEGNGKGDWRGFFNVPKNEKPQALADAIKGIGVKTARCIVNNDILFSKPRSWGEFKSRMKAADDICSDGIYYRTIVEYGRDNAVNLGYDAGTNCTITQYTEIVIKPVETKKYSHTEKIKVDFSVSNGLLLPGETEDFVVSYDNYKVSVEDRSNHNNYTVSRLGNTKFELDGTRIKTAPENNLNVEYDSGKIIVTDGSDEIYGEYDKKAQTVVTVDVKQSKFGVDKKLATKTSVLENGKGSISIADVISNLKSGAKFYFRYSVAKKNSVLFTGSSEIKSSQVFEK